MVGVVALVWSCIPTEAEEHGDPDVEGEEVHGRFPVPHTGEVVRQRGAPPLWAIVAVLFSFMVVTLVRASEVKEAEEEEVETRSWVVSVASSGTSVSSTRRWHVEEEDSCCDPGGVGRGS